MILKGQESLIEVILKGLLQQDHLTGPEISTDLLQQEVWIVREARLLQEALIAREVQLLQEVMKGLVLLLQEVLIEVLRRDHLLHGVM